MIFCPMSSQTIKMGIVEIAATMHPNSHRGWRSPDRQKSFAVQMFTAEPTVKAFFIARGKKRGILGCDSSRPAVYY